MRLVPPVAPRLLLRGRRLGHAGDAAAESESRDEDEVNSESDSVVVEEAELAMAAACGGPFAEGGQRWADRQFLEVDAPGGTSERGPISGDMTERRRRVLEAARGAMGTGQRACSRASAAGHGMAGWDEMGRGTWRKCGL